MTGRSYREEAVEPSVDLVALVRTRRLRWLGCAQGRGELPAEESGGGIRRVAILMDPFSWTLLTTGLMRNCWLWLKIGKLGNYM